MLEVKHNQSLLDICLQAYGSLTPLFELALANNLNVSTVLTAGSVISLPNINGLDATIVQYYKYKNITPATDATIEAIENISTPDGIGYMVVASTFKVA